MPQEITQEEYEQIAEKIVRMLILYKDGEITTKQIVDKIFNLFFVQK